MVVHSAKNIITAKERAKKARKMGFNATPFKRKRDSAVSVTKKK